MSYLKLKNTFSAVIIASLLAACNKQGTLAGDNTTSSTSPTIVVAASLSLGSVEGSGTDSVYLLQPCQRGAIRDSIAKSDLPASITTYLDANYAPYTFSKAFAIKNNSVITGYIAVIYFNDKPVGLRFDASGNFVEVLEQREKGDLDGRGWHDGGRFGDRGHPSLDSVSLSALPAAITQYLQNNFATDTLLKAYVNHDSSYAILSQNNGLFATLISADGTFIARKELTHGPGNCNTIAQVDLPSTILSYLDSSYPGYVFKKAFTQQVNGVIESYVVFIDANNTRYALEFDSTGAFVRLKTIN